MHCNLTKSTTAHRRPIDRCSSRRKANRVWSSSSWFDSAVQNFRMTYSIFDTFYHLNVFWCIDQIAFQYLSTAAFPAHCSPVSGRSVAPAVRMPPVVQRGADVPWATGIRLTDRPLREDIDVERELPSSLVHQKRCNKNPKKSSKQNYELGRNMKKLCTESQNVTKLPSAYPAVQGTTTAAAASAFSAAFASAWKLPETYSQVLNSKVKELEMKKEIQ